MPLVDVVVVSYNSREDLRACLEPLVGDRDIAVVVVDNASSDGSLESVADLPARRVALESNGGFSVGCNAGIREGTAPYVLLLNPDAVIEPEAVRRLVARMTEDPALGAVAPKLLKGDGSLSLTQRRSPRLLFTYARALFLHRLFPRASWTDEIVRDPAAYDAPASPDWISGACLLVRRSALQAVGGLDERYFLYREDTDLCTELRGRGLDIGYEPGAVCVHDGGASAPRTGLMAVHFASRIRYVKKHRPRAAAAEHIGIVLWALTHVAVTPGGHAARAGYLRALRRVLSRDPDPRP